MLNGFSEYKWVTGRPCVAEIIANKIIDHDTEVHGNRIDKFAGIIYLYKWRKKIICHNVELEVIK